MLCRGGIGVTIPIYCFMDFVEYRIKFTDHFPVIINIKVHMDND